MIHNFGPRILVPGRPVQDDYCLLNLLCLPCHVILLLGTTTVAATVRHIHYGKQYYSLHVQVGPQPGVAFGLFAFGKLPMSILIT